MARQHGPISVDRHGGFILVATPGVCIVEGKHHVGCGPTFLDSNAGDESGIRNVIKPLQPRQILSTGKHPPLL
jgi:hypothetical protein